MIKITVEFDDTSAWSVAEVLKRIGIDDISRLSKNEIEADEAFFALEQIRQALNSVGVAPR